MLRLAAVAVYAVISSISGSDCVHHILWVLECLVHVVSIGLLHYDASDVPIMQPHHAVCLQEVAARCLKVSSQQAEVLEHLPLMGQGAAGGKGGPAHLQDRKHTQLHVCEHMPPFKWNRQPVVVKGRSRG